MIEALEGRCLLAVTSTTPVPITVTEGSAFNGPVMDFTANDAGPFTATIVWGDSTPQVAGVIVPIPGGFEVDGTHTYAEDGSDTVSVQITDTADSTSASNTTTATVNEAALGATGTTINYAENASPTVTTGTFTDPGSPDPASAYTATINWGDGTPVTTGTVGGAAGAYSVTGSHLYGDEGTFTVTTTFFENNDPTFTTTATSSATITEADVFTNGAIVIPAGSAIEGTSYSGPVATFSDSGYPTNTSTDLNATINWGDGTTTAGPLVATGGGNFRVDGTHTFAEEGTTPVSVVVNDDAPGTATTTITGPVVVADAALTAAPVAVHGTEGAPLTNVDVATFTDADPHGTVTDYLATIDWGDGTPVTAGVIHEDAVGTFHVQGSHTYTEENAATDPITVSIIDNGDGRTVTDPTDSTATAHSTATIFQSPLLPVANAIVGTEGAPIAAGTPLATFTDTGGADPIGDYTATVNWGDGTGTHPAVVSLLGNGGNFQVTSGAAHTYAAEGNDPVTVTITDADPTNPGAVPTTAATTSTASISDAALTASATQPVLPAQTEGVVFSGAVSTFTDANPAAPASDYTATIDWGDGSPTSLGTFTSAGGVVTVDGVHTYKDNGSYTIQVVTTDVGGKTVSTTDAVVVTDPGINIAVQEPVVAVEGTSTGPVTFGTFVDPDPNSTPHDWSVAINWGDGTPVGTGTIALVGGDPASGGNRFGIVGSHTYADGPLTVTPTATITDVDNPGAAATVLPLSVTVVDAPLTSQGGPVEAVEGTPFTNQLVATVTDANPLATVADFTTGPGSVTINWGDGTSTPSSMVTASGSANGVVFSIFGSHTYAEEGNYQIATTTIDNGGSQTIALSQAIVADAKLKADPTQPTITTTESPIFPVSVFGAPIFTGQVGTFTDANPGAPLSDFRATVDWGDGTPQSTGTISQPGGPGTDFIIIGSHTYADSGVNGGTGTFPVTVSVNDVGGSRITIQNTASVADIPIKLTGAIDTASDSGASAVDAVSNNNQPTFHGTSEPYSHVTLLAAVPGGKYAIIGQTQAGSDGSWTITSRRLPDGKYTIAVTAIDQFGKTTTGNTPAPTPVLLLPNPRQGMLEVDTAGPRVTGVFFNRLNGEVDYTITDNESGLNLATLVDSANYQLTKPNTKPNTYLVTSVDLASLGGTTDLVRVVFNGGKVLRGGFYTFTIRDSSRGSSSVQDIAGNDLDGEFYGSFPSGNGVPGGDFVAMLDAIHDKVFAAQTVVGTASVTNSGQGGLPVGAVHSGKYTFVPPRVTATPVVALAAKPAVKVTHVAAVKKAAVPAGPKKSK